MRRIFDTECLLKSVLKTVKDNFNNEISLIDTEKSDYILEKINDDAWYFQRLGEEVFSYPSFVVWGMYGNDDNYDSSHGNNLKKVRIYFEVCLSDDGSQIEQNIHYKMLRYTRALESSINKNFQKIGNGMKFSIDNLAPTVFNVDDNKFRSAGIVVVAAITTN